MAVVKSKQRLVADPAIGVSDLLRCLEDFLDQLSDTNLQKIIQIPAGLGWKTASNPAWLARLAPLWKNYLAIAPNGVIPSKRHRDALVKLVDRKGVHTGSRSSDEFAERCDEWIRIGLSHIRGLAQNQTNKQRCMRKAAPEEQAALEETLNLLILGAEDMDEASPPTSSLVPVVEDVKMAVQPKSSTPTASAAGTCQLTMLGAAASKDPLSIFEAVLSRPSLDENVLEESFAKNTPSPPKPKASHMFENFSGFLGGMMGLESVETKDMDILKGLQVQKPINDGCNSQLQRSNKARKRQQQEEDKENTDEKGVAKPKARPKKKARHTKDTVEKTVPKTKAKTDKKHDDQHEEPEKGQKGKLQPAETEKLKKKKKKKKGNVAKKELQKDEKQEKNEKAEPTEPEKEHVPEGFDPAATRALNRKRFTSRHWHQAYDQAIASGMDEELAKAKGREGSQAASQEFEKRWPKPKKPVDVD